ncbi:MAG: hypothetical protein HW419_228 [Deltaproteobacteria bacterium]|nr:hypothetical protein [Deltaproteobacteria bacterium]
MIVKLRHKSARYPDLTPGLSYVVIGIEADDFRILNNQGRPYLYPSRLFKIIDSSKPHDWITERGKEGESYAYPQPLNAAGFFEDFFDAKPKAVATFWRIVNQHLVSANKAGQRAASSS